MWFLYSHFEKKCPSNKFNYKYMSISSILHALSQDTEWNSSAFSCLTITSPEKPLSTQELVILSRRTMLSMDNIAN